MKVLQVNCVYDRGSTGVLTAAIHRALLLEGHEAVACYGFGPESNDPGTVKLCPDWYVKGQHGLARITGVMYGGCLLSTWRLERLILKEKPDLVHLQCINGHVVNIYRLIEWLKQKGIPTLLTLHAEFMFTANCAHAFDCEQWKTGCRNCPDYRKASESCFLNRTHDSWMRMRRAFSGFGPLLQIASVSPWLRNRALQSPFFRKADQIVIPNGVDTRVFCPEAAEKTELPEKLRAKKIVLHVTSGFSAQAGHIKGGEYVLALAERLQARGDTVVVVAGKASPAQQVPENVVFLGEIRDPKQLAALYASADVTLLTSRRETFSMVTAESLCCGTPVAGFRCGGAESIAIPDFSAFCPWGDSDALEKLVSAKLDEQSDRRNIAEISCRRFSVDRMCATYLDTYRRMICKQEEK